MTPETCHLDLLPDRMSAFGNLVHFAPKIKKKIHFHPISSTKGRIIPVQVLFPSGKRACSRKTRDIFLIVGPVFLTIKEIETPSQFV
jgi:hypothetical protein